MTTLSDQPVGLSVAPTPDPESGVREEVNNEGFVVVVRSPAARAKYDMPLAEWLALPVSPDHYTCPSCGSRHFGTVNPMGYLQTLRCGDEFQRGCQTRYRPDPDAASNFLDGLAQAARGVETRYATGRRADA